MKVTLKKGSFKSFEAPFEWRDIPPFSMLTGPNGAGKSQLLEMIFLALGPHDLSNRVTIEEGPSSQAEVIYLPEGWKFGQTQPADQGRIAQEVHRIVEQIKRGRTDARTKRVEKEVRQALEKPMGQLAAEEIARSIPSYAFLSSDVNPTNLPSELSLLFHRYHLRMASLVIADRSISDEEVQTQLGTPPWVVMNRALGASGLSHRVEPPTARELDQSYEFRIVNEQGVPIPVPDLSSGEKTLLGLAFLLYNSREHGASPKLLLLDEPDAHLHPAMIKGFYNALKDVLVAEFDCNVIATTHRPDTIVMTPESELFEVFPEGKRVRPIESKNEAIARLSSNLLAVLPNTRCVLVEDEDDAEFFKLVLSILVSDYGRTFFPLPVFQPVSVGSGRSKISGGRTVVEAWVEKLRESGLTPLVHGLIDRDSGNADGSGIHVLSRYSMENYLFDPIVIYASLLDAGEEQSIHDIGISPGEVGRLHKMNEEDLQPIVDKVCLVLAKAIGTRGKAVRRVEFLSGQKLNYPKWLLEKKGHDLQRASYEAFGHPVSVREMKKAFNRVRMLPIDLDDLMKEIATS